MNQVKKSAIVVLASVGLCGGATLVQASYLNDSHGIQRLEDEHWKHPHMHHAMASLSEARKDLDAAEDVFKGHKQDAIDHVEAAIKSIREGLKEQNDESVFPTPSPAAVNLEDEHFPHMRHALERLKDAKTELESSDKIFGGHRDEAISHTDKAIKQIEDGLHDAK